MKTGLGLSLGFVLLMFIGTFAVMQARGILPSPGVQAAELMIGPGENDSIVGIDFQVATATPDPADACLTDLGTLTEATTRMGTWTNECNSTNTRGSYAHFYTFTLGQETEARIELNSTSRDTFLHLLQGAGRDGTVLESNDDAAAGTTDSRIVRTLPAGTYTVEATTYFSSDCLLYTSPSPRD